MSGKRAGVRLKKRDARVKRTRDALGDALIALMQEKPFEEVTVQQVLDRAGIGRSTFYEHFTGKDDLFLSDVEEFFEMMATMLERRGEKSNRVMPLREMLAHLQDVQPFFRALMASGKVHDVMELGRGH